MLETEYKELLANVVPGEKLVSETRVKMEAAAILRPASRKRLRTILIAAVVLAGIIGASAIALTGAHLVDWSGNTLEGSSWKEVSQEEWDEETRSEHQLFQDTIDKAPEDEIWILEKDSGLSAHLVSKIIHSYKEMESHIRTSAPDLMLLDTILQGYDFVFGQIVFYMSEDVWEAGVPLVSKEILPTGHTLFKFKLPEGVFQNIKSYSMIFANKAEDVLRIDCDREIMSESGFFPVGEGGSVETVTMPGMEAAIFIQNSASGPENQLSLRKAEIKYRRFYEWLSLPELEWTGDDSPNGITPRYFHGTQYSISATAFGKEELIKISGCLK